MTSVSVVVAPGSGKSTFALTVLHKQDGDYFQEKLSDELAKFLKYDILEGCVAVWRALKQRSMLQNDPIVFIRSHLNQRNYEELNKLEKKLEEIQANEGMWLHNVCLLIVLFVELPKAFDLEKQDIKTIKQFMREEVFNEMLETRYIVDYQDKDYTGLIVTDGFPHIVKKVVDDLVVSRRCSTLFCEAHLVACL